MGEAIENPGIDPVQESEMSAMAEDFQPPSEDGMGTGVQAQVSIDSGQLCATCLSVGFGIMAGRRGSHWALSAEEAEQLGNASGALLDKYCPDIDGGPEYAFIIAVGMVIAPRLMPDKQIEAANDEAANDNGGQDGDTAASKFAK